MNTALRTKVVVLPGGRVEISSPDLRAGQTVEVIVLLPEPGPTDDQGSVLDLIESLGPGPHLFNSPEDVDRYLNEERDSW